MEIRPKFVVRLPLREMALRMAIGKVWIEDETLTWIANFPFKELPEDEYKTEWGANVECKVKDKVSKLVLPQSLKQRMLLLVSPMGLEILKWMKWFCIVEFFDKWNLVDCSDIQILKQLSWSSTGAIDYQKTAEGLVHVSALDVVIRYKLACLYCLVDHIPVLWRKLPEETQRRLYDAHVSNRSITRGMVTIMESYWAYCLKEKESKSTFVTEGRMSPDLFYKYALHSSVNAGNKAATQHFLQKLTSEDRDSFLSDVFSSVLKRREGKRRFLEEDVSEVIRYLLSQMRLEQQMHVLQEYTRDILKYFLNWPLQDLFLDIAGSMRTFLPSLSYNQYVLQTMSEASYSGYYYPDLMQQCYVRNPGTFRRQFLYCFANRICESEDIETIKVIFRYSDISDRSEFRPCDPFFQILRSIVIKDKLHILGACLQEVSLSKKSVKTIKKSYVEFLKHDRTLRKKWKKVFKILKLYIPRKKKDGTVTKN
ncbi:uncharacterized protein LOC129957557 [Argiope bruennichi]|uniref:uncharacterized protein LOC129957557 n=1 Tax=Argiope bruennichi TaxID=94029 RepID=UPI002494A0E2|nr:uncharacterized protein LOC129957557 [Argiope bruennichi]